MMWIDIVLKSFTAALTVIATWRAGSRAAYLMDHQRIGIMEGPVIQKPQWNETNPMFELSEAFRHCVRLSIQPFLYDNVHMEQKVTKVVEPYLSLSPRPYIPQASEEDKENKQQRSQEETTSSEESSSFSIKGILSVPAGAVKALFVVPYSGFKYTTNYLASTTNIAMYWTRRTLSWRPWKESNLEIIAGESDWDYNLSTEADISFNATDDGTTKARVAKLAVFSPKVFENLRSIFHISEDSYHQSIFESGPFVSFQSNSKGAARSGGVFFFTRDGAYMIKTIKKEEAKTFLKMLPKYHPHMQRNGRKSLLTRFCGMYGVRIHDKDSADHGQLQTFVVMNAVFPAEASRFISERFDLKGSTVGREVSEEELERKGNDAVLKDLDLAREVDLVRSVKNFNLPTLTEGYGLSLGATAKAVLLSQLRKDVKLLVDCQVMDYSLLVGIVNMESHKKDERSARQALSTIRQQSRLSPSRKRMDKKLVNAITTPGRILIAPPIFIARKLWSLTQRTVSSLVTYPLPYYGSGKCVVDGGLLSVIHGSRRGDRAVYYMGLIDFLQPWTARKYFERKLKGVMGYDTNAISCVTPEEYASRFLEFLDQHLS